MSSPLMFVRDERTLPFIPVTAAALAALRESIPRRRLAYARSLYLALLELANEDRSDRVAVSRKSLGERSGCSPELISDLRPMLEEAGVVTVRERTHGGQVLEHEWVAVEPVPVQRTPVPERHGPPASQARLSQEEQQEETSVSARASKRVKVNGREVPQALVDDAVHAVEHYADVTGQTVRPFDGNGGPTDSLTRVMSAMVRFPEVRTLWPRMVDRVLAAPWWDGDPSVGVIFGPKVVERSIERARSTTRTRGLPQPEDFAHLFPRSQPDA